VLKQLRIRSFNTEVAEGTEHLIGIPNDLSVSIRVIRG
jgi:hypothetical protein